MYSASGAQRAPTAFASAALKALANSSADARIVFSSASLPALLGPAPPGPQRPVCPAPKKPRAARQPLPRAGRPRRRVRYASRTGSCGWSPLADGGRAAADFGMDLYAVAPFPASDWLGVFTLANGVFFLTPAVWRGLGRTVAAKAGLSPSCALIMLHGPITLGWESAPGTHARAMIRARPVVADAVGVQRARTPTVVLEAELDRAPVGAFSTQAPGVVVGRRRQAAATRKPAEQPGQRIGAALY